MPELTTTATFTEGQFDDEALTTIVARSVLEAALAEEEGAEIWFEIGRDGDEETAQVAIDLSAADLEEILRLAGADDVALTLDGDYVAGLFDDDPDVEAHGLRGAIAIVVTSAAILAPATQAAVPQATQQAKPQATAQATAQVSAASTAQVSSLVAQAQAKIQSKPQAKLQVSKAQLAKVSGLKLLRSGLAR
jgi:hypothetical protein